MEGRKEKHKHNNNNNNNNNNIMVGLECCKQSWEALKDKLNLK